MREEFDRDGPKETISVTPSAEFPQRTNHMAVNIIGKPERGALCHKGGMCWDTVLTPPHDLLLQHVASSLPPSLSNHLSQKQLQKSLGLHLFLEEFYEQNITPTISPRGDLPQHTNRVPNRAKI